MTATQPRRRAAKNTEPSPIVTASRGPRHPRDPEGQFNDPPVVPAPPIDPAVEVKPEEKPRGPLDPITRPLWRMRRPDRCRIMEPFIDRQIQIERWYGRVASGGDVTYKGTLLAIASTTTGSNADLLILKTVDGTVWAISTAQVAYVQHIGKADR